MFSDNSKSKTDTTLLKEINKNKVFNCVREHGPLPRVEICDLTGISKPTVTRLIDQMIKEGLLRETGSVESERGRHPINIDLVADAKYCIGLNLSKNTLGAAVVDMKMNIIDKIMCDIKGIRTPKGLTETIIDKINELLDKTKIPRTKIIGIGAGLPGLIDNEKGVIKNYALENYLRDIPLVEIIEKEFGFHTEIDNNCNTRMLGEYFYGYAKGYSNSMFVINSEGVGCSVIHDGTLNRKLNFVASGLGHITVAPNGRKCSCGGIGCVETFCSSEQIEQRANEYLFNRTKILCTNSDSESPGESDAGRSLTYVDVCRSVESGETDYTSILVNAAVAIACGIVNVINLVSPEIIIFCGVMFDESEFYYKTVVSEIKARIGRDSVCPVFVRRSVKDALYEIGAATMIMHEII